MIYEKSLRAIGATKNKHHSCATREYWNMVGDKHTERMGFAMYVQPCNEFAEWHAIVSETHFSGVLFRFDEGRVICGRYFS